MTKRTCYGTAVFFICLLVSSTCAQIEEPNGKFSDAAKAASDLRTKQIEAELRGLKGHEWAGEYFYGDGLGANVTLILAPENGFVFTWYGCLGLYDLNYGKVESRNGAVRLMFTYPNKREGFEGIDPELIPVRWGKRHYLIASDRIIDFTNAINAGTEPNSLFGGKSARFLLKSGDEKRSVSGVPLGLPGDFISYLLKRPINARISSIDLVRVEDSHRINEITLNAGSRDGLKAGMELYVRKPAKVFASATVTALSEHSATAAIKQWDITDPAPSTDWQLSTRLSSN